MQYSARNKAKWVNLSPNVPEGRLLYLFHLLVGLVGRNITLMYKRSMLGIAWTLIKPLAQLMVFALVFGMVLPGTVPNFAAFLFIGIVVWEWFHTSIYQSAGSIVYNRALIRQPGFPIAILPLVTTTTGLFHFVLSLPVLLVIGKGVPLTPHLLWLPALMGLQYLLIMSLSYLLAALNVTFRDTQHTLEVLLQLFVYLSGVFYVVDQLPDAAKRWLYLNPMVHVINAYRAILLDGQAPNWLPLGIIGLIAAGILPIGYQIFKRQSYRFVEEL
jgi:lipopolysaccharide transport system permease protein